MATPLGKIAFVQSSSSLIEASNPQDAFFSSYPPDIKDLLENLATFEETQNLLKTIVKANSTKLTIRYDSTIRFSALYNIDRHTISINASKLGYTPHNCFSSALAATLIFELFNANNRPHLNILQRDLKAKGKLTGKMTKDQFVVCIERPEHENALKTRDLVESMIQAKKLPDHNPFLTVAEDFDEHYLFQQLTGHSTAVAQQFDRLCPTQAHTPFVGTWGSPILDDEVPDLKRYFTIKAKVRNPAKKTAAAREMRLFLERVHRDAESNIDLSSRVVKHLKDIGVDFPSNRRTTPDHLAAFSLDTSTKDI